MASGRRKDLRLFKERFLSPILEFIHDSRAVGIILICCTIISLVISNSRAGQEYLAFWQTEFHVEFSGLHLPHTILHIINDGLMTIFFFLVGLEIKRELLAGELKSVKKSLLPMIGAVGGMIVPALLFLLFTGDTAFRHGWGIPMATDIAFSLGVLSLLGSKAPMSLKIFLTALAIIDDLGGILAIAIFYAGDLQWNYLFGGLALWLALVIMNAMKIRHYAAYLLPGVVLWYLFFNSGVHATISGVLLAMTIPLHRIGKLEHKLHDPVNFLIMPIFALANTAILLPGDFAPMLHSPVTYGVLAGLVVGKPLGIFLFSMAAVRLRFAALPTGMYWKDLLGMGMIAGIGFTMSIFIATLAFTEEATQTTAKVAIIAASLIAGLAGYVFLSIRSKKERSGNPELSTR